MCELINKLQIKIEKGKDITEMRRMGKEGSNNKRPRLLELRTWNQKMEILRGKNKLKGTEIYISEDFPKEVLDQRRELVKYMKAARERGQNANLAYNKLKVDGSIYTLDQLTEEENIGNPDERMVKTNVAKRTVYERSPEDGKGNKEGDRVHKMMRSVTSTGRGTKNY